MLERGLQTLFLIPISRERSVNKLTMEQSASREPKMKQVEKTRLLKEWSYYKKVKATDGNKMLLEKYMFP
jgi:hypothetical protein